MTSSGVVGAGDPDPDPEPDPDTRAVKPLPATRGARVGGRVRFGVNSSASVAMLMDTMTRTSTDATVAPTPRATTDIWEVCIVSTQFNFHAVMRLLRGHAHAHVRLLVKQRWAQAAAVATET
jgi:hypothetical protein